MAQRVASARYLSRRYARQLVMPEIGIAGQRALAEARVLCVGLGGLGTPVVAYLAAAGLGRLTLIDDDTVDLSNLQRQLLYTSHDVGRAKVDVAAEAIHARNPEVDVVTLRRRFEIDLAQELVRTHDLVIDGSDSFATRYLVNDAAFFAGRPNCFASLASWSAQVTTFSAHGRPCYRCLYPTSPPIDERRTCEAIGVLGPLAGIAGAWQAAEAIKLLTGAGESLTGHLLTIDLRLGKVRDLRVVADPDCPLCGERPTMHTLQPVAIEEDAARRPPFDEVEPEQIAAHLAQGIRLLDLREAHERGGDRIAGAVEIPASQLFQRLEELDPAVSYLLACRVGVVSGAMLPALRARGFMHLRHVRGGLLAYAVRQERAFLE